MFISLIRKYLWVFVLCLALTPANIFAQPDQEVTQPENIPPAPPKIVSPELGHVDLPKSIYRIDETIPYQVVVKWPEPPVDVRMNSPELNLENLELIGVGQETLSKPGDSAGEEQVLTLRFKAPKKGPAKINSVTLLWTQGGGISTSSLKIPSVELTIKNKPINPWIWICGIALSTLAILGSLLLFRKKKPVSAPVIPKTPEELYLTKINELKNSGFEGRNLLNDLTRLLERYLQEKFNWNRSQEDYNALQKKAEKSWDKKEVGELKELFDKIEFMRFSGSEPQQNELITLYQSARSFIERKIVV